MDARLTASWRGNKAIQGTRLEVGGQSLTIDDTYAASTTNEAISIAITAANVQGLCFKSSQNMTIKANSTSSPTFTWSLKAGSPLVWSKSDAYFSNPITGNVTTLYVTTTEAARLEAEVMVS